MKRTSPPLDLPSKRFEKPLNIVELARRSVSSGSETHSQSSTAKGRVVYKVHSITQTDVVLDSKEGTKRVVKIHNLPFVSKDVEYALLHSIWGIRFIKPTFETKALIRLYVDTRYNPKSLVVFPMERVATIMNELDSEEWATMKGSLQKLLQHRISLYRHKSMDVQYMFRVWDVLKEHGETTRKVSLMDVRALVEEDEPSHAEHIEKGIAMLLELGVVKLLRDDEPSLILLDIAECLEMSTKLVEYQKRDSWFPKWLGLPARQCVVLDAPDVWHAYRDFRSFHVVRRAHDVPIAEACDLLKKSRRPVLFLGRAHLAQPGSVMSLLRSSVVVVPREQIEDPPPPVQVTSVKSVAEAESMLAADANVVFVGAHPDFRYPSSRNGVWFSVATDFAHQDRRKVLDRCPTHYPFTGSFTNGTVQQFRQVRCSVDNIVYVPLPPQAQRNSKLDLDFLEDACEKRLFVVETS